jgi:hypothetical protein
MTTFCLILTFAFVLIFIITFAFDLKMNLCLGWLGWFDVYNHKTWLGLGQSNLTKTSYPTQVKLG